jgi:2,3-bisphosphoglycerate-independent phosphoglycerate mutase
MEKPDFKTPMAIAVREAYGRGEEDEALDPLVLVDGSGVPIGRMGRGDYVIFYDIRGEREIELTESLVDDNLDEFPTVKGLGLKFVTMIEYDKKLDVEVAYPPLVELKDTLSEIVSQAGLKQVKIVESEKSIHLGFFLNGKKKEPFPGEERLIVPTPKDVETFDKKPEMSIKEVSQQIIKRIEDPSYDLVIANFANIDVLGHIENEEAIKKAVHAVDREVGKVLDAARKNGVVSIVTADHGTVEKWKYPDGAIDTGHTNSPVPFMIVAPEGEDEYSVKNKGELSDVAPTALHILGLPKSSIMTGNSLLQNSAVTGKKNRLLLLIVDGWGHNDDEFGNLILDSKTPVMDELMSGNNFTLLNASGTSVGMPEGTVGNSEAGHLHIGAGRTIYSDRLRIDKSLSDGSFFENEAFLGAVRGARDEGKNLHLLGIVSFYSSHGSLDHLIALMNLAKREGVKNLYMHSMLGRRGERPESGARYIAQVEEEWRRLGLGKVVDVIGRFWSLDREENWDRIEKTYRLLVHGDARQVSDVDVQ